MPWILDRYDGIIKDNTPDTKRCTHPDCKKELKTAPMGWWCVHDDRSCKYSFSAVMVCEGGDIHVSWGWCQGCYDAI